MKKFLIAIALLSASLGAAAQDKAGAEAAMSRYAAATKTYDVAAMTALMHPEALKRFRTTIDKALNGPKGSQASAELLPLFAVSSVGEFAALSDADAYRRMNETIAKSAPEIIQMMANSSYEIVGAVLKDGIAYVTYDLRMVVEGSPVSTQVVQTLKLHDGKWLMLLPATADATIVGIESAFR